MTAKQHKWYLREWSAAFRVHWSGSTKGEAVGRPNRPACPMRDQVIATARKLAVGREDGRLSPDLLRRACHVVAIGRDVSSYALRNKQIDQVVAVFRVMAGSGDLAAQMRIDAAEVERARMLQAARAADASATPAQAAPQPLPDADRTRTLHGLRATGLPPAYIRELSRDRFGTESWESLPADKLLQLYITCKARAVARTVATARKAATTLPA